MTFVQVLIFAFGFFGVWCLKDFCIGPPVTWRALGVGIAFILISFVLSIGFIRVG